VGTRRDPAARAWCPHAMWSHTSLVLCVWIRRVAGRRRASFDSTDQPSCRPRPSRASQQETHAVAAKQQSGAGGRRAVRKDAQARDERRAALGLPEHVQLLPAAAADAEAAAAVAFGDGRGFERALGHRRREIMSGSIFAARPRAALSDRAQAPACSAAPGGATLAAGAQLRGALNGGAAAAPAATRAADAAPGVRAGGAPGAPGAEAGRTKPASGGRASVPARGAGRPPLGPSPGVAKPDAACKPKGLVARAALALKRRRMSGVRLAFSEPA